MEELTMTLKRAWLACSLTKTSTAGRGRSVEAAVDCFGLRDRVPRLRLPLCHSS